ncbi:hypothetical protein [Thioalkalivibrio sp. HK1]|uniref:hypothetical protein n=1 Tax=Thioalkalivibrio sp. HK1 TaxID=1469245 RepID=UPI0004721475|nr:hypothetical protein [Thioalkalivibrio sp. HK1]
MSTSESTHPNRIKKRIEDRQADPAGRVAALERLVEIAEARAAEERQSNREERRVAWSVYAILVMAMVGAMASLVGAITSLVS